MTLPVRLDETPPERRQARMDRRRRASAHRTRMAVTGDVRSPPRAGPSRRPCPALAGSIDLPGLDRVRAEPVLPGDGRRAADDLRRSRPGSSRRPTPSSRPPTAKDPSRIEAIEGSRIVLTFVTRAAPSDEFELTWPSAAPGKPAGDRRRGPGRRQARDGRRRRRGERPVRPDPAAATAVRASTACPRPASSSSGPTPPPTLAVKGPAAPSEARPDDVAPARRRRPRRLRRRLGRAPLRDPPSRRLATSPRPARSPSSSTASGTPVARGGRLAVAPRPRPRAGRRPGLSGPGGRQPPRPRRGRTWPGRTPGRSRSSPRPSR